MRALFQMEWLLRYQFELLLGLRKKSRLSQNLFWYTLVNVLALAKYVMVQRIRIKDSVEYILRLSKTNRPKADHLKVLHPIVRTRRG